MNDYDPVALALIARSPGSNNSIKWEGSTPSNGIYFSFYTPLVWQYIKPGLPCDTKIPINDLIITHALHPYSTQASNPTN